MSKRRVGGVMVLAALAAAIAFFATSSPSEDATPSQPEAPSASSTATAPGVPSAPRSAAIPTRQAALDAPEAGDSPRLGAESDRPASTEQALEEETERRAQKASAPPPAGSTIQQPPAEAAGQASVTKDEVRAAIRSVLPRIKECYEDALPRDPSLAGKVVVRFEIEARDGKGKVVSGEVPDSETRSPFFEACVLERVAGAEFPAPEGEGKVTVSYPFHFDPGGGFGAAARE